MSGLLPSHVRDRIRRVAEANAGRSEFERAKAIDAVLAWARLNYPQFFRAESSSEQQQKQGGAA